MKREPEIDRDSVSRPGASAAQRVQADDRGPLVPPDRGKSQIGIVRRPACSAPPSSCDEGFQ